jgi:S-DNA-T family DNA segregation ATPase FtsK/SpoIIIE
MINIDKSITNLQQKGQKFFDSKKKSQIKSIENKTSEFDNYAQKTNSTFAFLELDKLQKYKILNTNILPELVKIGNLSALDLDKKEINKDIPLLLPYTKNNATTFFLDKENSKLVHSLFQTIALRFMLSILPNLARYHLIDVNFGRDFSILSNVKNPVIIKSVIAKQNDINQTINELSDKIISANQTFLARCPNILEHNKTNGSMAEPYDFVFISNFPNGFSTEAIDNLFNLINNFNATRAGVYFFISYNKDISIPFGADVEKIIQITTNIYKENDIYKIGNLDFISSNDSQYSVSLDSEFPVKLPHIIDSINNTKQETLKLSFDTVLDKMIETKNVWANDASYGINVPIGYINQNELHYFKFGKESKADNINNADYQSIIGGLPGFGKTILLHDIIINTAFLYSPFEVNFYLIDCANGVGFNPYKKLPHAKVISTSNEIEYARSVLENLTLNEFEKRASLFKNANVADFEKYNEVSKKKLPRIIIIIDEFQVLLESNITLSRHIESMLVKLTRLGRKYGINSILCTQGLGDLNFNDKFITRKYVFSLPDMESERIIKNNGAVFLTQKGAAIMNNTQHGGKDTNINFQVAYLDDNVMLYKYIDFLDQEFKQQFPNTKIDRFISDGETGSDLAKNNTLFNAIVTNDFSVNDKFCDVLIGEPAFVRNKHSYVRFRKQSKSNLLIVGNDIASAVSILGLSTYQLIKQSSKNSKFYIFDMFNIDNKFNGKLNALAKIADNVIPSNAATLPKILQDVEQEMNDRIEKQKSGQVAEGRIVLVFAYFKNADCFMKAPGTWEEPETKGQLFNIFKKGPDLGIHTLLYSLDYTSLMEVFEYATVEDFENRIALYQGDSLKIIKDDMGSYPKEKGLALLQAPDGATSYAADLFKRYSEMNMPEKHTISNNEIDILKQLFEH